MAGSCAMKTASIFIDGPCRPWDCPDCCWAGRHRCRTRSAARRAKRLRRGARRHPAQRSAPRRRPAAPDVRSPADMPRFNREPPFEHDQESRIGILLVNLGTPDAPTPRAVRRYLAEFLADPRVVEIPRFLWLPILHGLILRTRPAKSAKRYGMIWTKDGPPLLLHSIKQHSLLRGLLSQRLKALGL